MDKFNLAIGEIEKTIGYEFSDKSLIRQAFTRTSFCNEVNIKESVPYQSNEVLEFFGDSLLSSAIVTVLIEEKSERYIHGIRTKLDEGDFTIIRSKLSDKKNLSENITRLGLEKHLIMGEGDEKMRIEREKSVREDLFESIIGAVYIDSGFNMKAVIGSVCKMLDINEYLKFDEPPAASAKNILQEWCADKSRRLPPPRYELVSESGPDHDKTYVYACFIDGKLMGEGRGRSIKAAQGSAAAEAIKKLKKK